MGYVRLANKRRKSELLDQLYMMRASRVTKKEDWKKIEKELQRDS